MKKVIYLKMKKYLLLTEYFPESEKAELTGGVENRCFNIVRVLSEKYDVKVICSRQKGQKKHSKIFDCDIYRVGPEIPYSSKGDILKRFMFAFSAYNIAKKQDNIDLIEAESFLTYIPTYFAGRKIKAKKVIATWHETWVGEWIKNKGLFTGLFGEIWERTSIKLNWDLVISVSQFTKDRLLERKIKCKDIQVIHNGIDFDKINGIKVNPVNKNKYIEICVLGRLTPMKRVDFVIKALSKIIQQFPNVRLNIIGSGPELTKLKGLVKELNLIDNVKFYGFVEKYEDVIKIMKSSNIYVSASELEGFGITVLEAMACRLPVILSDIKPFKEVSEGKAIYFENVEKLSQWIYDVINNKRLCQEQLKKQDELLLKYQWEKIIYSNYRKLI